MDNVQYKIARKIMGNGKFFVGKDDCVRYSEMFTETEQNIFDTMKANSTCRHEGHPLRLCYAKSVVGVECCLKNCVLFPKEG